MIGCLRTRVRKQPIIALYSELENFTNLQYKAVVKKLKPGQSMSKLNHGDNSSILGNWSYLDQSTEMSLVFYCNL